MRTNRVRGHHLQWLIPVIIVLLVALIMHLFLGRRLSQIPEVHPVDGVLDITEVDLSKRWSM